jgi:hypothetical protein
MGDSTRHEPWVGCDCLTCQLVHRCGIPADYPGLAEMVLYANMRVDMSLLVKHDPMIGSRHGPWAGARPWFQLLGRALDFGDSANDATR